MGGGASFGGASVPFPGLPSFKTARKRMRAASFSSGLHADRQAHTITSTASTHARTLAHTYERIHTHTKDNTTTRPMSIRSLNSSSFDIK
jgi:hypothetical protein